jgi:hypothetical protein
MRPFLDLLYNFRWVREGEAARSSQAHFGGLKALMNRHGLAAIINLRGENSDLGWWRYEKRVCAALGARHFDAMLDSRKLPTRPMLVCLMRAFDEAPRPFLLKCSGGQDRTALASALYLIHRDGWGAREAARDAVHGRTQETSALAEAVRVLRAGRFARRPLCDWIADTYEPERLAEWLEGARPCRQFRAHLRGADAQPLAIVAPKKNARLGVPAGRRLRRYALSAGRG